MDKLPNDQHNTSDITLEMDKVNNLPEHQHVENNSLTADMDAVDGRNVRIPRAVPEIDDENDDRPLSRAGQPGVDDSFFETNNKGDARPRRPSYAIPGYNGPGFVEIDGVLTQVPDVNAYQHKKTLAQGMMDLALLSANANQMRYVLETYSRHPYALPSLIFITMSIIFQIAVGVGLILNGRYNVNDQKEICRANKINNYTVIGIFIVTVVNVFISAFGVADDIPVPPVTVQGAG